MAMRFPTAPTTPTGAMAAPSHQNANDSHVRWYSSVTSPPQYALSPPPAPPPPPDDVRLLALWNPCPVSLVMDGRSADVAGRRKSLFEEELLFEFVRGENSSCYLHSLSGGRMFVTSHLPFTNPYSTLKDCMVYGRPVLAGDWRGKRNKGCKTIDNGTLSPNEKPLAYVLYLSVLWRGCRGKFCTFAAKHNHSDRT